MDVILCQLRKSKYNAYISKPLLIEQKRNTPSFFLFHNCYSLQTIIRIQKNREKCMLLSIMNRLPI